MEKACWRADLLSRLFATIVMNRIKYSRQTIQIQVSMPQTLGKRAQNATLVFMRTLRVPFTALWYPEKIKNYLVAIIAINPMKLAGLIQTISEHKFSSNAEDVMSMSPVQVSPKDDFWKETVMKKESDAPKIITYSEEEIREIIGATPPGNRPAL